jgi:WD40 repeat protein
LAQAVHAPAEAWVADAATSQRTDTPIADTSVQRFGDYELLEKVAEGGMGVVYRARQLSLNRIVAVKMIQPGRVGSPEMVLRFRAEAEAAASLHHPNIVAIHETGECEGQHYFSMDYIEGQNLAEAVREGPLPSARAAQLVAKIAAAVHYAHQHKILHRDLKPSNVLLDEAAEPRVTDFGLARRLGGDSTLTLTGQVFGSPQFMPPEQASGRHGAVGVHSDVYGLGAVLYHVLTARPPFVGETMETTLAQVLEQEPVSPRLLNASVPRDLETICLKCLEKEPSRRYVSAQAVVDELGRFLRKEPILARPVSRPEKVWRWCRRKPALATALGAVVLVAAVGLVGILTQWRRAEGQRRQAELQRQNAEASELFARQNAYAAAMNLAQRALANNEVGQAISLLEKYRPTGKSEPDLRHWEWRYLWQLCEGDELSILHRYSSGINSVAVSRDGRLLAVGKWTGVSLWDLATMRPIAELPDTDLTLAFSPTKSLLARARNEAGQAVVKVWNVNSLKLTATLTNEAPIQSVAFSPDGKLLATLDNKGNIRVSEWESNNILVRKTVTPIRRPDAGVVAFLPDGHRLAIGGDMGALLLLDLQSGKVTPLQTQTADGVTALAVSPAGDLMAAGFGYTDGTIGLWELSTGKALEKLTNHTAYVRALAFTPDGRRLVSGGADGTIRVWSVADRTELWRFRAYRHGVVALALLPDGKTLVSGGPDGALCRWDCSAPIETRAHASLVISHGLQSQSGLPAASYGPGPPDPKGVRRFGVAFAPDSRSFITSDPEGALAVYDARSMQIIERLAALGTNNWGVALSPDGRWLAAANASGQIEIWDWKAGHAITNLVLPFQWVGIIRFSRTGQFLLASSTANDHLSTDLRIWGTRDWAEVPAGRVHHSSLLAADLSPDDRLLALADLDGTVQLSTFPSGHPLANFKKREGYFAVRFSSDGRLLALARRYGSVALWDVVNRRDFATLAGHALTAWGAVFSSDGRRLLTAGRNPKDAVKLWDIATQSELLVLSAEGQIFFDVGFSPDGNTLVASSFAGVAHFWRAPSWAEIEAAEKGQVTP